MKQKDETVKKYLSSLLYLVPLGKTMKYLLEFFCTPPKRILDCTAGERWIWKDFTAINQRGLDGEIEWDVHFSDKFRDDCNYKLDCKNLQNTFAKGMFDVLVFDPPFQKEENEMYNFGVKIVERKGKERGRRILKEPTAVHSPRKFYFTGFEEMWKNKLIDCVESFNHATNNFLIVKIGDRHENGKMIPNTTYTQLAFNKEFNPKSEFEHFDTVYYRPFRALHGARIPYSQQVVTEMQIFKKETKER